tara:strand:- start:1241 stop:2239 length:999 start_codon:yes stop_codon:yes gene_type:complete
VETIVLQVRPEGLFCPAGDFFIDPRVQVERALITHAHSDHARSGHKSYLCSNTTQSLLKVRLDSNARVEGMKFGEKRKIGDATVSFHPAGHILGSAQIRVEVKGHVWVVSGDYKPQVDRTCEPFELVPCHGFISECTFGLPVYRWMPEELIHRQINAWWKENRANRTPSLLFAYSLGKAQRVLAGLDPEIGPIFVHGAVDAFVRIYRDLGIDLPVVEKADPKLSQDYAGAIILAPPAVEDSNWTRSFRQAKRGFASGWMAIRGARRRKNLDRGFVLSDHADWKGLIEVIEGTGAEEVLMTHGNGDALVRYLSERSVKAAILNGASIRGEEEE